MEFVKVGRDDLIKQFKDYIDLLKNCPRDMEFHTLCEFCGIDKRFLEVARKYNEKLMIETAKEQKKNEEQGSI